MSYILDNDYIARLYDEYRRTFFSEAIPSSDKIDFTRTDIEGCLGYSKHNFEDSPEYEHEIAFTKIYKMNETMLKSALLHEMIHVWQYYTVSGERYGVCSNYIAHDRVFKVKMASINATLENMCYGFKIFEAYDGKIEKVE